MAVNPDEDTEFNDALRKHGIIPPRPTTPPSPPTPPSASLDDLFSEFTPSELQELGEDANDDEIERLISEYRNQRIEEARKEERRGRFGRVYPIGREDYTREVSEASEVDEDDDKDGKGTGVVCFLYKDGIPHSDQASLHLATLASRYPRTKFVSIVGSKCIANLPDSRIPMIIVYRKGEIRSQAVAWGVGRPRKIEELEALLISANAIDLLERPPPGRQRTDDEDSEDDFSDDNNPSRSATTSTNARAPKNIRHQTSDDEEFEFDL